MGRFSKTVHIKGSADKVKDLLCEVMKKRGFVPCSEDEAALSYLLAFGGSRTTLVSENYRNDPKRADEDARHIAEGMNTSCFSVEIVDSDFAILKLFGGGRSDEVIVGDGSGYGIENAPKGERSCWEPLLAEGCTWEQFAEAWGKDEVFVEDTLWKAAPLLGIEPKYMFSDHKDLSKGAESDKNIDVLFFAKATDSTKSKSVSDSQSGTVSFDAAFTSVFGEYLNKLGFKKIGSRHSYFVRVVPGGEIIHVVTYAAENSSEQNYTYKIYGGAATVYDKITFTDEPPNNSERLISNADFYRELHLSEDDLITERLKYKTGDPVSMFSGLPAALCYTMTLLLPRLDKVKTISQYNDFYHPFGLMPLKIYVETDKGGRSSEPMLEEQERLKHNNLKTLKSYGIDMPDT